VVGLTVALANGTVTRIEGAEVDAWLGSMGMLGVIVDADLSTHPLEFVVCQRRRGNETHLYDALVDPSLAGFEARVVFSGDDFESFVIRTCRTTTAVADTVALTSLDDPFQAFVYDNVLLDWALFLGAAVPHLPGIDDAILASSPADSTVSGETVATVNDYRLPVRFHPHFDEEYAVPVTHCNRLMRRIASECIDGDMNAFFYIRRIDPARGWLTWSPTASCAVRVEFFRFTLDGVDVETRSRRCIETHVLGLGGSGHFGKPWFSSPHDMLRNSPRRHDFVTYRNTLDPDGTFMTPYTRSLLHNVTYDRPPVIPPSLDTRLLVWRVLVGFNLVVTAVLSVFLCMDAFRATRSPPPPPGVTTPPEVKSAPPPRDPSVRRSRI
jgi:FAD/FMN-containing dehydrogenase